MVLSILETFTCIKKLPIALFTFLENDKYSKKNPQIILLYYSLIWYGISYYFTINFFFVKILFILMQTFFIIL